MGRIGAAAFVLQDQPDAVAAEVRTVRMRRIDAGHIRLRLSVAEMPGSRPATEAHVGEARRGLDIAQAFGRLRECAEGRAQVAVSRNRQRRIAHAAGAQVAHGGPVTDAGRGLQPCSGKGRNRMPGNAERITFRHTEFRKAGLPVTGVPAEQGREIIPRKYMQWEQDAVRVRTAIAYGQPDQGACRRALVGLNRRSGRLSVPAVAIRKAVAARSQGREQGRFVRTQAVAVGQNAGFQGVENFDIQRERGQAGALLHTVLQQMLARTGPARIENIAAQSIADKGATCRGSAQHKAGITQAVNRQRCIPAHGRHGIHPHEHRIAAAVAAGVHNAVIAASCHGRIEKALYRIGDTWSGEKSAAERGFQLESRTADADCGIILDARSRPYHHHHAVGAGPRAVIHGMGSVTCQHRFKQPAWMGNAFSEPESARRGYLLIGMCEAAAGVFGAKEYCVLFTNAGRHQRDIAYIGTTACAKQQGVGIGAFADRSKERRIVQSTGTVFDTATFPAEACRRSESAEHHIACSRTKGIAQWACIGGQNRQNRGVAAAASGDDDVPVTRPTHQRGIDGSPIAVQQAGKPRKRNADRTELEGIKRATLANRVAGRNHQWLHTHGFLGGAALPGIGKPVQSN